MSHKKQQLQPSQSMQSARPAPFGGRAYVAQAKPGNLLRLPIVEDRTGKRKSSIYAGWKDGTFPAPVRLSARAVAWRAEDIDRWITERQTASLAQPANEQR